MKLPDAFVRQSEVLALLRAAHRLCLERGVPHPPLKLDRNAADLLRRMLGANTIDERSPLANRVMGFPIKIVDDYETQH